MVVLLYLNVLVRGVCFTFFIPTFMLVLLFTVFPPKNKT